jgi:hypothetical protein
MLMERPTTPEIDDHVIMERKGHLLRALEKWYEEWRRADWGYYVASNANNQRDMDHWRPRKIKAWEQTEKLEKQLKELRYNPPIDYVD